MPIKPKRRDFNEQFGQLTDQQLLTLLLAQDTRLSEQEETAFKEMEQRIGRQQMSPKQRQWAEQVYDRLDLQAERALNLISTGQVAGGPVPTFDWERNRPLKPPGRM